MLAYNHSYSEAILKYGADSRSNIIPAAVEEVLHYQKGLDQFFRCQKLPSIKEEKQN